MNRFNKYIDKKRDVFCVEHKLKLKYNKKTGGYPCKECSIDQTKERLEEIRAEIRAERISYGEIAELQSLKKYIDKSDVELLEWAIPERMNLLELQSEHDPRTCENSVPCFDCEALDKCKHEHLQIDSFGEICTDCDVIVKVY